MKFFQKMVTEEGDDDVAKDISINHKQDIWIADANAIHDGLNSI